MSPERHIEKLLRAFAKTRREQAGQPFELHPATRHLLQGEVARQHRQPAKGETAWTSGWRKLWPRIAFATALLAVLGLVAFLVFPPAKDSTATLTLSKQESSTRALETLSPSPSVPTPLPTATLAAVDAVKKERSVSPARAKGIEVSTSLLSGKTFEPQAGLAADALAHKDAPPPDLAAARAAATSAETARLLAAPPREAQATIAAAPAQEFSTADEMKTASSPAPSAVSSRAAREEAYFARSAGLERSNFSPGQPTGGGLARRTTTSTLSATGGNRLPATPPPALTAPVSLAGNAAPEVAVQNFAQLDFKSPRPAGRFAASDVVLASFQFEQRGQQIRIVDRDGSVYTGTVESPSAVPSAAPAAKALFFSGTRDKAKASTKTNETSLVLDRLGQDALPPLLFNVRGTNATLKQVLVFTGNVQQLPGVSQYGLSNQVWNVAGRFQNQSPVQNSLSNARVSGRAQFTDGRVLEINAVAVPVAVQPQVK